MPISIVVDGYSAENPLVKVMKQQGQPCLHVQSTLSSDKVAEASFEEKDYLANVVYEENKIDALITEIKRHTINEKISCVIAGSDSGVKLAADLSKALGVNNPQDVESLSAIVASQSSDIANLWKKEYNKKGIPSSYRNEPSSVVDKFFFSYYTNKTKDTLYANKNVIDMGCGLGRNSIFFAEKDFSVTSIDIVPENITQLQDYAKERGLKLTAICGDVTGRIPADDKSIDIVIDIFCYKHQVDNAKRESYRKELCRVLKDEGFYLLSLAGKDDGYYGQLRTNGQANIVDPQTQVGSVLFDPEDISREFADYKILDTQTVRKDGLMHGKIYERVTHAFIMQIDQEISMARKRV